MSLVSRDPVLLTPGPLTTSLQTKSAMLRDWGSWDSAFNSVTGKIRTQLLDIINGHASHVCVPMQGSGTFSIEAAVNTLLPRGGHMLVLVNGAYGKRMVRLIQMMGRQVSCIESGDDMPASPQEVEKALSADASITHVGVIHCETSTGILNPLAEIAAVVEKHQKSLIIDAMSSFGALEIDAQKIRFDALIAASGKCIEGPPGMGFVLVDKEALQASEGNSTSLSLDLYDQWSYMEKTTQWRFTPPTHIVMAFHEALNQFFAIGGQVVRQQRYASNCAAVMKGIAELGLTSFLPAEIQAPIIVTVNAPSHPNYNFADFYQRVREKGYILYPGKLTQAETFRIGCIGAIGPDEIRQAMHAMRDAMREMGI